MAFCNASNCPTGCCEGTVCRAGNTSSQCGVGGGACQACASESDTCTNGVCSGCAASCTTGCCLGSTCTNRATTTCGGNGQACVNCAVSADSCSASGNCMCGSSQACATGQRCSLGQCVCDATSCTTGCCTALGQCVSPSLQNATLCGLGSSCAPCMSPPTAVCKSSTVRTAYQSPGACESGSCRYVAQDQTCNSGCNATSDGGVCVGDVCQGCLTPPPSICMGNVRRSYTSPGDCTPSGCTYAPQDLTCPFGCNGGACNADPCASVTCTTPPAPICSGADRISYTAPGRCSGGTCSYMPRTTACGVLGCNAATGNCNADPCASVTCNMPPPATCMGSVRHWYDATGTCSAGSCSYAPHDTTCTSGCANGVCQGDPCQGVMCTSAPPAICVAGNRRWYSATGTCASGNCTYPENSDPCTYGCANGTCNPNPCQGVTCNTPPNAYCSASVRHFFAASGTCSGGSCTYAENTVTCDFGCVNGSCLGDPCAGVSCTSPPATTCVGSSRRVYSNGTCSAGSCSYTTYNDTLCPFGCTGSTCNADPCASVTCNNPPAPQCVSGSRRVWRTGACSGGTCSYTLYDDTLCPFGCSSGSCNANPCLGVDCSATPATTCASGTAQRIYTGGGSCAGGVCGSYPSTVDECDTPPPNSCVGSALTTYSMGGTCFSGTCSYAGLPPSSCPFGCNAASTACKPDPCLGVTCTQPAATCANGSTQRLYSGPETCSGGVCGNAPFTDTACPAGPAPACATATVIRSYGPGQCTGAGSCSNSIDYLDCSAQPVPAPTCSGNSVRTYIAGSGTCSPAAVCAFASSLIACTGSNNRCVSGFCECNDTSGHICP